MSRLKYGIAEVFRRGSGGNHTRSLRSKFEKVLLSLKKKLNKPERVQVNRVIIYFSDSSLVAFIFW